MENLVDKSRAKPKPIIVITEFIKCWFNVECINNGINYGLCVAHFKKSSWACGWLDCDKQPSFGVGKKWTFC